MTKIQLKRLVVLLLMAGVIYLIAQKIQQKQAANEAKLVKKGPTGPLIADAIIAKPVMLTNNLWIPGELLAAESIEITAETAGRVLKTYFEDGKNVKKGDLLIKLDDENLRAQLNKAKILLQEAKLIEDRQRALFQKEIISAEEFERATTSSASLQADVDLIQAQLLKTEIRAPFSGVLSFRLVSEGSFVQIGQKITQLIDRSSLRLAYAVPEKYAAKVRPGTNARFTTETSSDTFAAIVYAFEPLIDQQTRSIVVRAMINNPSRFLIAGAYAKVMFALETFDAAISVPTEAVVPDMNGKKVFTVKNGVVEPKMVETGIRLNNKIQITNGINTGDTVLISGILQARPGAAVNPKIIP